MLQVITGMYFRDLPTTETPHRRTLYTNASFDGRDRVDLPIGHLVPSTNRARINTISAHFTERLAVPDDGSPVRLLSTGGEAIADDLAVVLSFALNVTVTSIHEKAARLIGSPTGSHHDPNPADILVRTFSPRVRVSDDDINDLQTFTTDLLALKRGTYERAMRAMRRIVTACERALEDPTLSYTDFVAALESLSSDTEVPTPTWPRLDLRKRRILDPALCSLAPGDRERIQAAILQSERAGIKNRFVEFVLGHTRPSFYRTEAMGVERAVREPSLRRALSEAYDARSANLHALNELPFGNWLLIGGAECVTPPGTPLMLTHAGLNRLARHVVRTYIGRGSTELDSNYRWRDHLPNVIRAQLASEFYLGMADAMEPSNVPTRAGEFLDHVIEAIAGRQQMKIDMRPALGRIEQLLNTHRKPAVREPALAIYFLWHEFLPPFAHRPTPEKFVELAQRELQSPSIWSFAVCLLLGEVPPWTVEEWCELAEQRFNDLQRSMPVRLPSRIDSALWICVARCLRADDAVELARAALGRAVECSPGHERLVRLEREFAVDHAIKINVRKFVLDPTARDDP